MRKIGCVLAEHGGPVPIYAMSHEELEARRLVGLVEHYQARWGHPPTWTEMSARFGRSPLVTLDHGLSHVPSITCQCSTR